VKILWQGVYFTKNCAKKARKFFSKRKVIEKEILTVLNEGEKPSSGTKDVYKILFKKPQNKNIQKLYTKKQTEIKKIFTKGELLKFKYVDGCYRK
jgi:hypothetical protein